MPGKAKATQPETLTGLPITGYQKEYSQESVDSVNRSKQFELDLAEFVKYIKGHDALEVDRRWAAVAVTHFEQGFMALNRSIFKPDSPFADDPK